MKNKNLIIIFLLVLVAVLAYSIFSKKTVAPMPQNEPNLAEQNVKETYTYTNHGFSIELPKGFVPKEVLSMDGNIDILFPNSTLVYVPNVILWEKTAGLPQNRYIKDQKIGETTFKVYSYDDGMFYWFKRGNVGYLFRADIIKDMETFKFVGWPQITGNKDDLVSFSIKPGQEVSGKITATGSVKGGYFFEANIGVNVLDANKKLLRAGYGMSTTDWMTSAPVAFTTSLDFTGLPKGNAYIEIHNDNASGLPENDKSIFIPIVIK